MAFFLSILPYPSKSPKLFWPAVSSSVSRCPRLSKRQFVRFKLQLATDSKFAYSLYAEAQFWDVSPDS